ncbi:zinc-dependent alcohol dehydrogenase [Cerasicoccus maritimus]|uniref:zinc-dependent alcohol dehydrogenase n=1 Tax=Cerasicoccus maritimus TaxID=490089 RepID=UPI002852AB51|nr:zinc-binding dehydrogenase [Cerasicoccus maritimus]
MPDNTQLIDRIVTEVMSQMGQGTKSARPSHARVAQLTAPKTLEIKSYPLRPIRDDEMLVKVEACGVCGTDIHCYKSDPFGITPVVLGHEGTGVVVEVGSQVKIDSVGKPVKPGDHIVTSILETSEDCGIAKYNPLKANLCDDLKVYGLLPDEPDYHFNGYFGEYLIIRPGSSFFVVNDMSLDLRVLIEPAAVVCHALERAKSCGATLNFRTRVIVQGCGPIGLMMIAVLRTYGVNNIIAIDGNDSRLKIAETMGADMTLNYTQFSGIEDLAAKVNSLTKGLGAHFGFQVTGVPAAFANLFHCIRRGGGICEVGHFVDGGECAINPHHDICKKEITVTGSWVYNSFEYPNAYHFLQRAERIGLPVTSLITHKFPLEDIQQAFDVNIRQESIKAVVTI